MDSPRHGTMILNIFKIGGSLIDEPAQNAAFIKALAGMDSPCLVVHGGGKVASNMSRELGIPVKMTDGRRITDGATLKVVTMTYAGLINKSMVANLQAAKVNSIGLTGADANIIEAKEQEQPSIMALLVTLTMSTPVYWFN